MAKWKRIILVMVTIFACIGCDQFTKAVAKSHLPRTKALSFAHDTLRLDYNVNKGAELSFEHLLPEKWRGPTFSLTVALFLGLLIIYLIAGPSMRPSSVVAVSLFCGGALSNLLDRVVLSGHVVDFLNIGWGSFRSCIFNVADTAIVVGMFLFGLNVLRNILVVTFKKPAQV